MNGVIPWMEASAAPEYFYAKDGCTWHGPAGLEEYSRVDGEGPRIPCCPRCGRELIGTPTEEEFWGMVRDKERNLPRYEEMLHWSENRCFDSFETMQSAWRQAMEGRE